MFLNVAGYCFKKISDPRRGRMELRQYGRSLDLKGTVFLTPEGLNASLAGKESNVRFFLAHLAELFSLPPIDWKESWHETLPFKRMLVRIKPRLLPLSGEKIDPEHAPAPRISPQELDRWLAEKKEFLLLDTRNLYEVNIGTFRGARHLNIRHFRRFAEEARTQLADVPRDRPVVTFCTGGIRCEKAAPALMTQGFREVYQLDGGILGYFQAVGGKNYNGLCFVFDQRTALDPRLKSVAVEVPDFPIGPSSSTPRKSL